MRRLMHIRMLGQRKLKLIMRGDKDFDVPEKERIKTKVSAAQKKAKLAVKAQASRARSNVTGGIKRQVKRVRTNVATAIKARKAEALDTAYKIYMRKQDWER
jgi:isopentenyl phosphate kinase